MSRPLRVQYPDALYHVTNRGNERKAIYRDDADRKEFLKILSQSITTYGVILHSFVLMENHYHLLVQTPLANLGEFMRHFNITYTSHYNRRHNRAGHLFQGRYKSFLVELDSYLSQVSRYIHLNPVKIAGRERMAAEKKLQYLWDYRWSSLPGFADETKRFDFMEYETVLAAHGGDTAEGRQRYREQIIEDLTVGVPIRERILGQSILGGEGFVSRVKEQFLAGKKDRERPDVGKIHQYLSLEAVLDIVEEETGEKELLRSTGMIRQLVMTALYQYAGLNNREIGELFNVDYSTVSQGRKRLREKAGKDPRVGKMLINIGKAVSRIKI